MFSESWYISFGSYFIWFDHFTLSLSYGSLPDFRPLLLSSCGCEDSFNTPNSSGFDGLSHVFMMNPEGASSTPSAKNLTSNLRLPLSACLDPDFVDIPFPYVSASTVPGDSLRIIGYPRHDVYSDFMTAYNLPYQYALPSSYALSANFSPSHFPINDLNSRFSTTGRIRLGLATTNGYLGLPNVLPDQNISKQVEEGLVHYSVFLKSKVYDINGTRYPFNNTLLKEFYEAPPFDASKFTEWLNKTIDVESVVKNLFNFDYTTSSLSPCLSKHPAKNPFAYDNPFASYHYPYVAFNSLYHIDSCFVSPSGPEGVPRMASAYRETHKRGLQLITAINTYN